MSRTDVLVDTAWVRAHLDDPSVVLVEVDEDTAAYDTGHIPGAVKIDWRRDLQAPGRRDLLDRAAFERLMSANGITNDQTIVCYGGNNNWFAAYFFWAARVYGHRDLRLLDGGRKKWELDGGEWTTEVPRRTTTEYHAGEPDTTIRAFRDEVLAGIGTAAFVDVRSPGEFSGELGAPAHLPQENVQARGHVPTAVNVPWSKAAAEDGTFRSDDELAALYATTGDETIVYCRIGERSSHTWFVLTQLLDRPNVRNYDGSWLEYGALIGVPVER